jgi:hypothetical protein
MRSWCAPLPLSALVRVQTNGSFADAGLPSAVQWVFLFPQESTNYFFANQHEELPCQSIRSSPQLGAQPREIIRSSIARPQVFRPDNGRACSACRLSAILSLTSVFAHGFEIFQSTTGLEGGSYRCAQHSLRSICRDAALATHRPLKKRTGAGIGAGH